MATFNGTIVLKNNATAGAAPVAGNLTNGEIAINTKDGILYGKTSDTGYIINWNGTINYPQVSITYLIVAGGVVPVVCSQDRPTIRRASISRSQSAVVGLAVVLACKVRTVQIRRLEI